MSSRIVPPGDPRVVAPIAFRQISGSTAAHDAVPPPAPDCAIQAAQIRSECEARIREAQAAGHREGEADGRVRGLAEVQPVLDRLAQTIVEMAGWRSRLRREAEADMLKLAMAIARRVLRRELAVDPEALHGLVLAALEKLDGQEISRVRVHPAQASFVAERIRGAAPGGAVEIVPDASREPGTVIFETARGNLDASVETQLREIERGLADRLRQS